MRVCVFVCVCVCVWVWESVCGRVCVEGEGVCLYVSVSKYVCVLRVCEKERV